MCGTVFLFLATSLIYGTIFYRQSYILYPHQSIHNAPSRTQPSRSQTPQGRSLFTWALLTSQIALLTFYGISHALSARLLPRLGIHSEATVAQLTEPQLTALSAYLSSPSTTARPSEQQLELAPPGGKVLKPVGHPAIFGGLNKGKGKGQEDPLDDLKIETEKRRAMQADIAHLRMVGTYRGRR